MVQNKAFIYKSIPNGIPVPGKNLSIEEGTFDETAPPPKGGFTTKNLYASYDPAQRGWMRDPSIKSYSDPMIPGEPVLSVQVIAKVLKSDNFKFPEVAITILSRNFTEEYSFLNEGAAKRAECITLTPGIPLTAHLNVLGVTGLTAYGSLMEIGQPKKGDVILISAAAGAVGQMVGQIAVRLGLHVIGSVGDDKKLDCIVHQLGFASGFNYKKENLADAIKTLAPNGLDIYFDNVGGELLDVAFTNMKDFGRIIACGTISTYNNSNDSTPYGLKNYSSVVRRRLRYQGFISFDPNITKWKAERDKNLSKWILDGSFKSIDYITDGIDNAIDGFLGMLDGKNVGKSILKIAEE
ncbi:hypothetical protein PV08_03678 [Exophiala spinifera]|uniref:Enoyl reductase (ER) domain-containing protein n=1 Tax=Exophiala spinifera TaxID=91928 RepID=A0A0D2BKD6_9EURO|nr:uncharacterized protein PV08_03678 [Exophiala spinifera]KIW19383.1 hypothetical protein PV08_03678 [Exophiala spinifera]